MIAENIILKLNSGEEIVCKVTSAEESVIYEIENPLLVISEPVYTRHGVEESISFKRWIHFSEESVFRINKNSVMLMCGASEGLSKFYEYCVTKMQNEFDEDSIWMEATNDDLDEIAMEEALEQFDTPMSKTVH
jgi:hypothetical protein